MKAFLLYTSTAIFILRFVIGIVLFQDTLGENLWGSTILVLVYLLFFALGYYSRKVI